MVEPRLRDWYLAQLGVTPYRQRTRPNPADAPAKESLSVEGLSLDSAAPGVAANLSSAPGPSAVAREADVPRPAITAAQQSVAVEGAENSAVIAAQASATVVYRSRLRCWQTVAEVLVLDASVPGQTLEPSQAVLLANILRAIKRLPDDLPKPELIDWPPVAGTAGDIAGARINLAMFLAGRARVRPFQWVLAMGDELRELLAPAQDVAQNRALLECGATAIFTPGLAVMAADPASKAATWAAIRFLAEG